jgi:protein-tyrosine phosphatase
MFNTLHNSFQEVIPGLYIGSQAALSNTYPLIAEKITHLLGINNYKDKHVGFTLKVMNLDDHEDTQILPYFQECIDFIKSAKRVLVFCAAGRSRSATIVAAFLIQEKQMSLDEALMTINKARPVRPNEGFLRQLEIWERSNGCRVCRVIFESRTLVQEEDFDVVVCQKCGNPMAVVRSHMSRSDSCTNYVIRSCLNQLMDRVEGDNKIIRIHNDGHIYWHIDSNGMICNYR